MHKLSKTAASSTENLIGGVLLRLGLTRFAKSDSSLLRAVYIFSHPMILICIVLYAICFTVLGQMQFTFISFNTSLPSLFSNVSSFPTQTWNFFNLWIVLTPVLILIFAARIDFAERILWEKRWGSKSLAWQFGMIIFSLAILFIGISGFLIPGDPYFCEGCTTNSMLGLLVIYGLLMPMSIGLLVAAIFRLTNLFVATFKQKFS